MSEEAGKTTGLFVISVDRDRLSFGTFSNL